ncbi:bromodomain-containing protein [Anaeramoeba flamelloides]|uniref:Bromodomain-containing protein n=1 Tax=Anaeramoeba flamelloides TaxID=1746091 RepID=A0ABQ8Y6C8_9EUKA|nr:bromodomain-containing protein [Anaeramoeba flamelloides]
MTKLGKTSMQQIEEFYKVLSDMDTISPFKQPLPFLKPKNDKPQISMFYIRTKLSNNEYASRDEVFEDFKNMFANAKDLQPPQSYIYRTADTLLQLTLKKIESLPPVTIEKEIKKSTNVNNKQLDNANKIKKNEKKITTKPKPKTKTKTKKNTKKNITPTSSPNKKIPPQQNSSNKKKKKKKNNQKIEPNKIKKTKKKDQRFSQGKKNISHNKNKITQKQNKNKKKTKTDPIKTQDSIDSSKNSTQIYQETNKKKHISPSRKRDVLKQNETQNLKHRKYTEKDSLFLQQEKSQQIQKIPKISENQETIQKNQQKNKQQQEPQKEINVFRNRAISEIFEGNGKDSGVYPLNTFRSRKTDWPLNIFKAFPKNTYIYSAHYDIRSMALELFEILDGIDFVDRIASLPENFKDSIPKIDEKRKQQEQEQIQKQKQKQKQKKEQQQEQRQKLIKKTDIFDKNSKSKQNQLKDTNNNDQEIKKKKSLDKDENLDQEDLNPPFKFGSFPFLKLPRRTKRSKTKALFDIEQRKVVGKRIAALSAPDLENLFDIFEKYNPEMIYSNGCEIHIGSLPEYIFKKIVLFLDNVDQKKMEID